MTEQALVEGKTTAGARQPGALWTLSWTELWERFSFYGIQVILAYYIYYSATDGGLGLSEFEALAITGAYGGAVYLSQPVGAWMGDRVFSARTMVAGGAVVVMGGHITLAVTSGLGGLLVGLGLIVLGTGALFPNVLAMMNYVYEQKEHSRKREVGFSLYYAGVLIGAFAGPMATGWLQVAYGFHAGFSAAAFGMLLALAGYALGLRSLPEQAKRVPNPLTAQAGVRAIVVVIAAIAVIVVLVLLGVITTTNLNNYVIGAAILVSILYFAVMSRSGKVDAVERGKVLAFIPFFITATIAWTLILQLFTTFAVYADQRVDLTMGPITIPAAYISVFQVITGIIAGPLIASAWQRREAADPAGAPSAGRKLGVSMLIMTATYLLFALLPVVFSGLIPLVAVIVGMVLLGISEVSFAPLFLSTAGKHAPRAFNAQMMALAGLTLSLGASLSGYLGQLYVGMSEIGFFLLCAGIAAACAGIMFVAKPAKGA
ncbi:peptide MFS transporter [Leucobacter sp.]